MSQISELDKYSVFRYFEEISKIPRKSGDMDRISNFLVEFAKDNDLDFIQERCKNVLIRKKATKGYEHIEPVLLQGHIDMVCEKNADSIHDFDNDPIKLIAKDDYIYADNTTLGADNGIAVAYMMALLTAKDVQHPAIEALFTVDEETTMLGAFETAEQNLRAKYMINLDMECDDELLLSSAGGCDTLLSLPVEYTPVGGKFLTANIKVHGLKGGHSGGDINKNRGNSIQIMGRILYELNKRVEFEIESINGGSKVNAIPRECECVMVFDKAEKSSIEDIIKFVEREIKYELKGIDEDFKIQINYIDEKIEKVFNYASRQKLINALMVYSSGVMQMSLDVQDLVDTSNNLGIITTDEKNKKIIFHCGVRSCIDSQVLYIAKKHEALANILNANIDIFSIYPGWRYKETKFSNLVAETFEKMYSKPMKKKAAHAGVECGIFSKKMPDLDIVSIGPTMYEVHTPDEHISISSAIRTYEFLVKILENMIDLNKKIL